MADLALPSVDEAWAIIAEDFPLIKAETVSPVEIVALRDSVVRMLVELGIADAANRVEIPIDYARFLILAGGARRHGHEYGTWLYGPASVGRATEGSCRSTADRRPTDATLWLTIGDYSDRHEMTLCCDRSDPRFGTVIDGHDDHPWHDGGYCDEVASSFTGYLVWLQEHKYPWKFQG